MLSRSTSSSKKSDPFSTPARRRRIIADLTRNVLRQYCSRACINVHNLRIRTVASIRLQCFVRSVQAKKKLQLLVYKKKHYSSVVIQCLVRCHQSRKRYKLLIAKRILLQKTYLAIQLQRLYRYRKAKLLRVALIITKKLAEENLRKTSAINIQRVFRGDRARTLCCKLMIRKKKLLAERQAAAIKIQSIARRKKAAKELLILKRENVARTTIHSNLPLLWRRRQKWKEFRRKFAAIKLIQRVSRAFLARMLVRKLRQELLAQNVVVEAEPEPKLKPEPLMKTLRVHLEISKQLCEQLITRGPGSIVRWCVDNFILSFSSAAGFGLGTIAMQVVNSVETAISTRAIKNAGTKTNEPFHSDGSNCEENVVKVSQWMEGVLNESPDENVLPKTWTQRSTVVNNNEEPTGAKVSATNLVDSIEVGILFDGVVKSEQLTDVGSPIKLESKEVRPVHTEVLFILHAGKTEAISNDSSTEVANTKLEDFKFKFKNCLVVVSEPEPELQHEIDFDDSLSDITDTKVEKEFEEELIDNFVVPARPNIAVVKLVLDPSPLPTPIPTPEPTPRKPSNFHIMATLIQV